MQDQMQKIADKSEKTEMRDAPAERKRVILNPRAEQAVEQLDDRSIPSAKIGNLMRFTEFLVLSIVGYLIYHLYVLPIDGPLAFYPLVSMLGAATAVILISSARGYDLVGTRRHFRQFAKVLGAWTTVFVLFLAGAFLTQTSSGISRAWIVFWYVGGSVSLLLLRSISMAVVEKLLASGRLQRRAIVVGGGEAAEKLIRALNESGKNEVKICGIFDDRGGERSPDSVAGYAKLGSISELVEFGRRTRIDLMIVALPLTAEARLLQLLKKLWVLPVDIRISALASRLRLRPRSYSFIGTVPFLDVFDRPIDGWNAFTKRLFDITFSFLAIIATSPLMIGAAIAVGLTSKGPILFRQKRFGFNNEIIEIPKFRSMYVEFSDPEARKAVTKDDNRVTPIGRFIRKTSIDELPQLFSVLKGDLSLVGPRPHAVNAHTHNALWDEVVDGYFARHRVKPGVTGWAQINGWRGEVDNREKIERRIEHDLAYIEQWSVLFDLYILFATPFVLLKQENAY